MATFRYFRTFIDEESEKPFPCKLSRGQSCPLLRRVEDVQHEDTRDEMLEMEQSFHAEYVSQLSRRSQGMSADFTNAPEPLPEPMKDLGEAELTEDTHAEDSQTPAAEAAEAAPQQAQGNSFGSLGHPLLCRRPCIRFAKGSCDMGDACGYCHHSVHARFTHLDRRQRLQVREMDLGTLMATLLPHVRAQCVQGAFGLAANELIQLIQSEARSLAQHQRDKSLDRILRHMPLSALLALVSGREGCFQPLLLEQVELLRQRLPRAC